MKSALKIILLLLAVFPLWLTIVALGNETTDSSDLTESWRMRFNSKLLEIKDRKVQIIEITNTPESLASIDETSPFELDISQVNPQGISPIEARWYNKKGGLLQVVELRAKVLVKEKVPVATHALLRGSPISEEDFKWEWRDLSTLRSGASRNPSSRTVRNFTRENDVIYESNLQKDFLVTKGTKVRISVLGRGLRLSTIGIAQEQGVLGQTIKVLNSDSKKEIYGVVIGSDRVEVKL